MSSSSSSSSSSNNFHNNQSSASSYLIELELFRGKLWNTILNRILNISLRGIHSLTNKEVSHMLLRYLFNKIADLRSKRRSDPVFMTHTSSMAESQLKDDFIYFGIRTPPSTFVSSIIELALIDSRRKISDGITEIDVEIEQLSDGSLSYRGQNYPETANLAKQFPRNHSEAVALAIRYRYLGLETHGLANPYAEMGYDKNENILEAFATPFNRYFNRYHSAFPDLEVVFGSLGSFFAADSIKERLVMCNPPFDISIMSLMIYTVLEHLDKVSDYDKEQRFVLTLPNWKDVELFRSLSENKYCLSYSEIPKSHTCFYDTLNGKHIKPCDILRIILSSKSPHEPSHNRLIKFDNIKSGQRKALQHE